MKNKRNTIGIWGALALSVGTSIGWGSFVVTGGDYLSKAGLLGSIIGIGLGTLLMFIIAYNYHCMMNDTPDSGGIYSFVKHSFNGDHAFLAAWFLLIVYVGILWANVTSIALFSRYLFGDLFQFGRLYAISGYDVYLGEVLLCAGMLLLIGGFTLLPKRLVTNVTFAMVLLFTAAIVFVSLFSLGKGDLSLQDVSFAPTGVSRFGQIMAVLSMSPWAFIGFESISHSTGSFDFKIGKTLKVLLVSLSVSALIYVAVCQISVMAHPSAYSSWYDYIAHNSETGITGIPPFFVANHYLGKGGVVLFVLALFAIVATSIIGNIYAASNLIWRMAEDGIFPRKLAYVNGRDIPVYVRWLIMGATFLAIFLGRSAIGFIVDVNNIGGVIVYAYVSACAFALGRKRDSKPAMALGLLGLIASLVFGISHVAPVLFTSSEDIAQETFIVFVLFSLLGFAFFTLVLRRDTKGNFGNSSVAWVGFSIMVCFFSGVWIVERSKRIHSNLMLEITRYYGSIGNRAPDYGYLSRLEAQADRLNVVGMSCVFAIVSATLMLLFFTLYLVQRNDRAHKLQLEQVSNLANRDPLTGVKNNRAYVASERRIMAATNADPGYPYGLVVCDVNDLKYVNDRFGHDYGDEYIQKACQVICRIYKHSPVFRIGGDEFAVLLEGEDYENREALLSQMMAQSEKNARTADGIVIAAGMANHRAGESFHDVFHRADGRMYQHKDLLKQKRPSHNLR